MLNTPHWQKAGASPSPWTAGDKWRPLQLIVDDIELPPSPALELLGSFAGHRNPLEFVSPGSGVGGGIQFTGENETMYRFAEQAPFITGNPTGWWRRAAAEQAAGFEDLDVSVLERRLHLLDEACRDWIDGLVMPFDPALRERWKRLILRGPLYTAEEAAALSGLFLRATGERVVEIEPPGVAIMVSEERLYLLGATSLLTNYEFVWEGSGRSSASGDPTLRSLIEAVAVRLGRALKARDYLNVRRRATSVEEIWSDVLYFFESVLVCLQGAADAAARLLRVIFQLRGPRGMANWGRQDWWTALGASEAPCDEFDRDCLEDIDVLIGELRNSIHGEVLTSELRERVEPVDMPSMMGFPRRPVALGSELATVVLPAAVRRGGSARWAIHQISTNGPALIDPWQYAEAAIATTGEALSSVLSALARTPDFSELADDPDVRALHLGRVVQRENARLLFGVENLPAPSRRLA